MQIESYLSMLWEIAKIRDELFQKHSPCQLLSLATITVPEFFIEELHPIIFNQLTASLICEIPLKTDSAAGHSRINAHGWRHLVTCFHKASSDLCDVLAVLDRYIITMYVNPNSLTTFTTSRLIALDKCQGVRPIRSGKVIPRMIWKTILTIIGTDIQEPTGALQLCVGQQAGCEATTHSMHLVYEDPET